MPPQVLRDVGIWISGEDYAGVSNAVGLDPSAEYPDSTNFASDGWREFAEGGMKVVGFTLDGFFDADHDESQFAALGTEKSVLVVPAGQAPGDVAYVVPVAVSAHSLSGSIGDLLAFTYAAEGDGALSRGQVMDIREGVTADAVTPRLDVGPVSAARTLRAWVHVKRITGSLDLDLRSANAQAGATTSRATRNGITATGLYELTFTGTTTNRWWLLDLDVSGTADFDIAAAVNVS